MKKALAFLIAMVLTLSLVTLSGCGTTKPGDIPADSPYIGTWEATKAKFMDDEASIEEVLGEDSYPYEINLKADGTADIITGADTQPGVWAITADGFNLRLDGAKKDQKFKTDGDVLTSKLVGVTLTFEKKVG